MFLSTDTAVFTLLTDSAVVSTISGVSGNETSFAALSGAGVTVEEEVSVVVSLDSAVVVTIFGTTVDEIFFAATCGAGVIVDGKFSDVVVFSEMTIECSQWLKFS